MGAGDRAGPGMMSAACAPTTDRSMTPRGGRGAAENGRVKGRSGHGVARPVARRRRRRRCDTRTLRAAGATRELSAPPARQPPTGPQSEPNADDALDRQRPIAEGNGPSFRNGSGKAMRDIEWSSQRGSRCSEPPRRPPAAPGPNPDAGRHPVLDHRAMASRPRRRRTRSRTGRMTTPHVLMVPGHVRDITACENAQPTGIGGANANVVPAHGVLEDRRAA